jgi:hypothetical protein
MSLQGLTKKGIPPQAAWLIYLRIAVLVISLGILAACAYNLSLFGGYSYLAGYGGPAGFMIFIVG